MQTPASPAWTTGHDVQFYESEPFLVSCASEFLGTGVRNGQPILVIATEPHRQAIERRLREIQPESADATRAEIVWLDARDTLSGFMVNGMPDRERFETTVGRIFARIMVARNYIVVRAYGEMVDLLWADGNYDGALAVEKLWNDLSAKYAFHLLCAYSMGNFFKEMPTPGFRAICEHHGSVSAESQPLA